MRRNSLIVAVFALCAGCPGPSARPQGPGPGGPGVGDAPPPAPAPLTPPTLRLPGDFQPTGYDARLAIDPASPTFAGEIHIAGTVVRATAVIWLDAEGLRVSDASVTVDGDVLAAEVVTEPHDFLALRLPRELPAGATVDVAVAYEGDLATADYHGVFVQRYQGERYVISDFEPTAARRAFPCVDEPAVKVPWTLTLDVPADLTALSNAPEAGREQLDTGVRVHFAPTEPLPSYLIAFAVGPFELVDAGTTSDGAPMRIVTFRGDQARAAWAVESTGRVVSILEGWFGTPFPFPKLDSVPVPSGGGAMENAGLITYREALLLHDPKAATADERQWYLEIAGHEIAHQWFGDLVTPAWWDDLWLNEAFATWMEPKVVAAYSPARASRLPPVAARNQALAADELVSARAIRQPIVTRDDIQNAFDTITYQKGASVLRMFEAAVGADVFQAGVRTYLADHARGVATTGDFLKAIDAAAGRDVSTAFRTFLDQPGAPVVSVTIRCEKKQSPVVTLRQRRSLPRGSSSSGDEQWRVPVCLAYGGVKTRATQCGMLDDASTDWTLEGPTCPTWVLPVADGTGYYRNGLDADALDHLVAKGWGMLLPTERIALAADVRAAVRRGDLPLGVEPRLVPLLLRDGSAEAVDVAVGIAHDLLAASSDGNREQVRTWIRDTYGKAARKLGWLPDKKDDDDRQRRRRSLVPLVAVDGGESQLLSRAVELAATWQQLPLLVRNGVLAAAVRGSKEMFSTLRDAALGTDDAQIQLQLLRALMVDDDPVHGDQAMQLALDARVDPGAARVLFWGALDNPAQWAVGAAFVRGHFDEVAARMPPDFLPDLAYNLTATCDAGDRASAAEWAAAHIAPLEGGPRTVAQALESMDQCIAARAATGPELDAWLASRQP